jgi:protein O-mannosyl-transferase
MLRLRRDPGLALMLVALVIAAAIYAPTVGRGLVNYDDPWLYADNTIVRQPSAANVMTVFTDLELPNRYTLGAEYLPVRDLSVMTDYALWGEHYAGFHLTNLVIYLAAIALWFFALVALGVPRPIAGLALLIWAVHPTHAESVAWLSERKGLLGMMWAGTCVLAYAKFRAGKSVAWLVLATLAGVAAVWSKAIAAFAVGALAAIELVGRGTSVRRSLAGLTTIAVTAGFAFVPVVLVATRMGIVGGESSISRPIAVLGGHGFDLRLAAGVVSNAVSYPISTAGPSSVDIAIGTFGFLAIALVFLPRWSARVWAVPLRIAALLWLFGWLPIGHLVLPIQQVFVADRYMLIPSLGFALALAIGLTQLPRLRTFTCAVVVVAFAARSLDAQASWSSNELLWQRATISNPADGNAWAMYSEALDTDGRTAEAAQVIEAAFFHVRTPRLVMHAGLVALDRGRLDEAFALMTEAAAHGEPRAAANLANMLIGRNRLVEALTWARFATFVAPGYANGHRIRGKVARLIDQHSIESREAFERAYALEPNNTANRYNLGIAFADAGRTAEARALLESCLADPAVTRAARLALDHL